VVRVRHVIRIALVLAGQLVVHDPDVLEAAIGEREGELRVEVVGTTTSLRPAIGARGACSPAAIAAAESCAVIFCARAVVTPARSASAESAARESSGVFTIPSGEVGGKLVARHRRD
jgi:hypothetical protein